MDQSKQERVLFRETVERGQEVHEHRPHGYGESHQRSGHGLYRPASEHSDEGSGRAPGRRLQSQCDGSAEGQQGRPHIYQEEDLDDMGGEIRPLVVADPPFTGISDDQHTDQKTQRSEDRPAASSCNHAAHTGQVPRQHDNLDGQGHKGNPVRLPGEQQDAGLGVG